MLQFAHANYNHLRNPTYMPNLPQKKIQRIEKLTEKSFMLSLEEKRVPESFYKHDILDPVFCKESFL